MMTPVKSEPSALLASSLLSNYLDGPLSYKHRCIIILPVVPAGMRLGELCSDLLQARIGAGT
jgi:hypothetical protein